MMVNSSLAAPGPAPEAPVTYPLAVPTRRPWRAALLAPLVLAWPWLAVMHDLGVTGVAASVKGLLLALLLGTATVTDLLWHRIFNWTTYTAVLWVGALQVVAVCTPEAGVPVPSVRTLFGGAADQARVRELLGLPAPEDSVAGLLVAFIVMLVLYSVFHGGAGDLKLVTALGAVMGSRGVLEALIYTYIVAGVAAVCYLVWKVGPRALAAWLLGKVRLRPAFLGPSPNLSPLLQKRIPMALYVALGALAALVFSS